MDASYTGIMALQHGVIIGDVARIAERNSNQTCTLRREMQRVGVGATDDGCHALERRAGELERTQKIVEWHSGPSCSIGAPGISYAIALFAVAWANTSFVGTIRTLRADQ